MIIHLDNNIVQGIIDNTVRGQVDLRLWFNRNEEPLQFLIAGDCSEDIAGCRVDFYNRKPQESDEQDWLPLKLMAQNAKLFEAGEITLSNRRSDKEIPTMVNNALTIEFFVDTRLRLLVEIDNFDHHITLPEWQMTWGDANACAFHSMDRMRDHITACVNLYCEQHFIEEEDDFPRCHWDDVLNQAESRAAIYRSVRDKYIGRPNALANVAYVLDIPHLLGRWQEEDRNYVPAKIFRGKGDLALFDYLKKDEREPVHKAMQHDLFQATTNMTQKISLAYQRLAAKDNDLGHMIDAHMKDFARFISNVLASIILFQDDNADHENKAILLRRIKDLKRRIKILMTDLPDEMPSRDSILHHGKKVFAELTDFMREIRN